MNDRHGISELTLENFKAFSEKRQHMPIKPLTLVYGPNSSGKSSLLQAIALAHEAVVNGTGTINTHRTRLAGDSIDLGGFQQYVHRREATRNVNLGFRLDVENYGKIFIDFTIGTLPDTEYQGVNRPVYTKQFSVRHRGKVILSLNFNQSGTGVLMEYDKNHHFFVRGHSHYYHAGVPQGKLFPNLDAMHSKKKGIYLSDSCQKFIDHTKTVFSKVLSSMLYLGAPRYIPDRNFSDAPDTMDPNWRSGSAWTWDHICGNQELRDLMNRWLGAEDRLGTPYHINVRRGGGLGERESEDLQFNSAPIDRLMLVDMRTSTTVSHKDVGLGVSQVLPVLATALGSRERLIAIEQPELHLHPSMQAELADVFLNSALLQKNTVIIETHSEVLILRVLRRIRETTECVGKDSPRLKVQPDQVCVIYVQPTDFGSRVLEIPLTSDGEFGIRWPDGFFPEQSEELF